MYTMLENIIDFIVPLRNNISLISNKTRRGVDRERETSNESSDSTFSSATMRKRSTQTSCNVFPPPLHRSLKEILYFLRVNERPKRLLVVSLFPSPRIFANGWKVLSIRAFRFKFFSPSIFRKLNDPKICKPFCLFVDSFVVSRYTVLFKMKIWTPFNAA